MIRTMTNSKVEVTPELDQRRLLMKPHNPTASSSAPAPASQTFRR